MTREEHKKAIIENLNAMVDKLEDDTEYFDALYHLDMLCKEIEPCEDAVSRAEAIKAMEDKAKGLKNLDTINGLCGAVAILYDLPSVQPINQNIKALGEELRTFRGGITDKKVLTGFNMAIALCNKHLADMRESEGLDEDSN